MTSDKSQFKPNAFKSEKSVRDLKGNYETLVVNPIGEPPFTPNPATFDQIKIVVDDLASPTARRLYIYSYDLKDWLYMALST